VNSLTLVDTHCHLNFEGFNADREAVIERAKAAGVTRIIAPAVDVITTEQVVALAAAHSGVYAAVGVHPNSTANFDDATLATIEAQSYAPKVVAIGEIGLDYYWDDSPKDKQWAAFEAQLALAKRRELPVIIHNRNASADVISILETWAGDLPASLRGRAGVMHSFSADMQTAKRALAAGFYLGFTGPITYKNADLLRHIAAAVPLDRMLIETDAPFLTPAPHRGKRNEPAYVALVAERLAALRVMTVEAFSAATTANAKRLFGLETTSPPSPLSTS
jgi:TatD DNase family protein